MNLPFPIPAVAVTGPPLLPQAGLGDRLAIGCTRTLWTCRIKAGRDPWQRLFQPVANLARCLLAFVLLVAPASAQSAAAQPEIVRVGFSMRSMGDTNRVDVMAAMKAWMNALAKEQKLTTDPRPEVYDSADALLRALQLHLVDVVSTTAEEFFFLEKNYPLGGMFTGLVHGKVTEQYVLLVRKDRAGSALKALQGETLVVLNQPRASLAPLWLETELLRSKLPSNERFFSKVTYVKKPNMAILPVFFKQAGAALVTRSSFETAGELNPQLVKELRVLIASPELLPALGAYPAGATSSNVKLYRQQALHLHETQAGKLVLNLFQNDAIVEIAESDLGGTRSLLAEHARLKAAVQRKGVAP